MNATQTCGQIAERLTPYAEGTLAPGERASVEAHLRECRECRAAHERLSEVRSCLAGALGKGLFSRDFNETTGRRLSAVRPEEIRDGEDDEEAALLAGAPGFFDSLQASMGSAPWWIISGAFHGLLILLVFLIGMVVMQAKSQDVVIVTDLEKQVKPPEPEKKLERDILEKPVVVQESEAVSEQAPIVTHEVVEFADQAETANESDAQDTKGQDGISDIWLGGTGTVGSIGVGGGGRAGAFGRPTGAGGRLRRAIGGGGGKATESAVDAALAWLARHQEADGHWDTKKYGGGACVSGGWAYDESVAGLALLAFLGAGHTDRIGKHKDNVRRAIDWIISKQSKDGRFASGPRGAGYEVYDNLICTLALAEASAMTRDPKLKETAQKAIDYLLTQQQANGGWNHATFESTSVHGWAVMALKSAKVAGLNVPEKAFEGALRRIDEVSDKDPATGYYGMVGYTQRGQHAYNQGLTLTAVGMVALQFLGHGAETQNQAEMVCKNLPKWDPNAGVSGPPQDFYHWYYGTLGLFQTGGGNWKDWNEALKTALIPNQHKGGALDGSVTDLDGSWDYSAGWGPTAGRVYSTAMGALCLEVYYRYLPLYR